MKESSLSAAPGREQRPRRASKAPYRAGKDSSSREDTLSHPAGSGETGPARGAFPHCDVNIEKVALIRDERWPGVVATVINIDPGQASPRAFAREVTARLAAGLEEMIAQAARKARDARVKKIEELRNRPPSQGRFYLGE